MNIIDNTFSRQETSPSAAKQDFFQILDFRNERLRQRIAEDREICIINRPNGENIV
jgi:hypothetical protein